MTRTEIHRHAQTVARAAMFSMPTPVAEALTEEQMNDLLQELHNTFVMEVDRSLHFDVANGKWTDGR